MMWRVRVLLGMLTLQAVVVTAEVLLELRFDGAHEGVASDTSGNGRHARIVGASMVAGRIGRGIAFADKSDHLRVGFVEALGLTRGTFTISCWFKPDAEQYTRSGSYELLGTAADRGPGWRLYVTWASVVFRSGEGYGDARSYWQVSTDPSRDEVLAGQWNHVAVTRDGQGVARIYLNGRLCRQSEKQFAVTPARRDVSIGSYQFGYAYPFVGVLDEVAITNHAMSPRRVFEHAVLGRLGVQR